MKRKALYFFIVAMLFPLATGGNASAKESFREIKGFWIEKVDFTQPGMRVDNNRGFTVLLLRGIEPIANQGKRVVKAFRGVYEEEIPLGKEVIIKFRPTEGISEIVEKSPSGK
ncbi:MAG: hypothetical protein UX02_C0004G0034 [Candidatus Moranbacteria bacterium GW2011_GWC1_45_18]|nr:MAG: hypothetical protein UT79_C0003G0055 [Candidatus Moranbacteria bacterium GW2011_GWC2_40_12]KKT33273.1 MAG: hypothetical protein UW19_C0010G0014 [Candidatus Moranbacteria bacterium GW2011_GWF2_44_10]KKT69708.1 MAG: hypothetical protein UW66_C0064G0004 [Candidatus Moranbacteria bacterium GW2011_GWF1_44_4]KKT99314.1 MAG: hypothetical protein UX02_C0004G0034 [Candidatus Moranbacteria bacterium GW2011_GWC1_45_18]OGI36738.1 MAG: hypothetical protein A2407_02940 [Candidatus Moranbacteria bacte